MNTQEIRCPRCDQIVTERFYGPCSQCRSDLRSRLGDVPSETPAAPSEFEPKMNVTPNAVALRDD